MGPHPWAQDVSRLPSIVLVTQRTPSEASRIASYLAEFGVECFLADQGPNRSETAPSGVWSDASFVVVDFAEGDGTIHASTAHSLRDYPFAKLVALLAQDPWSPRKDSGVSAILESVSSGDGWLIVDIPPAASPRQIAQALSGEIYRSSFFECHKRALAAARLATVGISVAALTHDISNPLMALQTTIPRIERARSFLPQGSEMSADMGRVLDTIGVVTVSVRDMLRSVRLACRGGVDGGASREDMELVPLSEIFDATVALVTPRAERGNLFDAIDASITPSSLSLPCHAGELTRALTNLVVNAVDAIVDSSASGIAEPGRLPIRLHGSIQDSVWVRIAVEDDGPGLPAHVAGDMRPFYTGRPSRGEGMGLGLAICIEAARIHGGELVVESRSSPTRLVLMLPRGEANH